MTRRDRSPKSARSASVRATARPGGPVAAAPSERRIGAEDLILFAQGRHALLHERLGAHPAKVGGKNGVEFAVWAPHAERVSVIGDWNGWDPARDPLRPVESSGIWTGFVAGVNVGALYKYRVVSRENGYEVDKADPLAFRAEQAPSTASVVATLDYDWTDAAWIERREAEDHAVAPMSIYEVHLGSWRRPGDDPGRMPGFRELAEPLAEHVTALGFTHVELLPPMEHPFYGSWGYQTTGYFAATSRWGSPQDLMYLIDTLHQRGIGVVLDWVPSHFPGDAHALGYFDGTRLYEYPDPRVGYHQDWKSYVFNYGLPEVQSFLLSSAMFWIERYHVDAIRVDAVASMLYLDYSRPEGQWVRNKHGGRENLEAIAFLRRLNETVHERAPGVLMIAEESTAWPMVSRPVHLGGLGFDMKWDMGWMHDTLEYFKLDPIHRKFHHNKITFRMVYAFSENFVLALSHDEVVHGKASLVSKMSGDRWQRFANLRALYGYMWAQPGKKLLFMGGEFGQWREWNHDAPLDWELTQYDEHAGIERWVADLNRIYRDEPALHRRDFDGNGFRWIDCGDADQSVVAFMRFDDKPEDGLVVLCNFTPVPRHNYRVGLPTGGTWRERLNSDAVEYGGSGVGNLGAVEAVAMRYHDQPWSVALTLPPLSVIFLERAPGSRLDAVMPAAAVEAGAEAPGTATAEPDGDESLRGTPATNGTSGGD